MTDDYPMKITLISPYSQIVSIGLRHISACLKQAGFETSIIFLPDIEEMMVGKHYDQRRLLDDELEQITAQCAGAGLVGVTVMTNSFNLACQITQALHASLEAPVLWGGMHPTVRPQECLQHADLVCIGEGEEMIVDLARCLENGQDYHSVNNLAYLDSQGRLVANPIYPLIHDLDSLPFPDFDFEEHYVLHEGRLLRFTPELMEYYLSDIGSWTGGAVHSVWTTRGCPYACTYCANNAFVQLYDDWSHLRRRSPENVIAEIEMARQRLPSIAAVVIRDDTFLANPSSYVEEFSRLYKERIGLPFRAYTTAQSANREKLQMLVDAGLRLVIMGIQSGSPRIQKMYKRKVTNEKMLAAAHLLHEFGDALQRPMYDVITDNPYETADERFETLSLIHQLPLPYRLGMFSLTFFPGTELREQAAADGLLEDEQSEVYDHNCQIVGPSYYNLALFCHHLNLPRPLLVLLAWRPFFNLFSWGPLDRLSGWMLYRILGLRLRSNQRLYARRQQEWLGRLSPTEAGAKLQSQPIQGEPGD